MDIVAYCLMNTHYHILMCVKENPEITDYNDILITNENRSDICPISWQMQRLSISYTKAINKYYGRVGSLFQGAFQAKNIDNIEYSRTIINYIHQNPVEAGFVQNANEWKYSSSQIYDGLEDVGLLDPID